MKLLQQNSALRLFNFDIENFDVFKWLVIPISLCLLYRDDNIISLGDLHHSMVTLKLVSEDMESAHTTFTSSFTAMLKLYMSSLADACNMEATHEVDGCRRESKAEIHPAKHSVLVVKPGSRDSGNEELAAIGVRPRIGHTQSERPVMAQAAVKLIFKFTTPNGCASCAIPCSQAVDQVA